MPLPAHVDAVVTDYLSTVDKQAPGLVEGCYLVGSVALDDFRPGASDIDFVAVTARPADAEAVRRAHLDVARRHRRPHFNGLYVTWQDLTRDPGQIPPGLFVFNKGVLRTGSRSARDPITWHTLAQCGVAVRGPAPAELDIWTDRSALCGWVRENLDAYWRQWHRKASRPLHPLGLATLIDWGPVWVVLGVSRLHYTLTTGRITSKAGAGEYARETFPAEWHRIVDEALRIRRGEQGPSRYRSRWTRRRDTLSFLDQAITAAHRVS